MVDIWKGGRGWIDQALRVQEKKKSETVRLVFTYLPCGSYGNPEKVRT